MFGLILDSSEAVTTPIELYESFFIISIINIMPSTEYALFFNADLNYVETSVQMQIHFVRYSKSDLNSSYILLDRLSLPLRIKYTVVTELQVLWIWTVIDRKLRI